MIVTFSQVYLLEKTGCVSVEEKMFPSMELLSPFDG